jgi:hypothetical protein
MSFTDRLVLWLHIGFALFTIGPVSAAIMSTPRYIRTRNLIVVRYLYRTTRIFALITLGVLIFGIILGQRLSELSKPWLTAAITLFVVAIALLVIIVRDQRKAISAMEAAEVTETAVAARTATAVAVADAATSEAVDDSHAGHQPAQPDRVQPGDTGTARHVATVERGRIATMGAVVSVIWLVILVLMVWH